MSDRKPLARDELRFVTVNAGDDGPIEICAATDSGTIRRVGLSRKQALRVIQLLAAHLEGMTDD